MFETTKPSENYSPPVILICAFNERKNIGNTLDLIKKIGFQGKVIVVNDGSTDKTRDAALVRGAHVIDVKNRQGQIVNRGKSGAFFTGLKEAVKKNPEAIVTLDADMIAFQKQDLERLIESARTATSKKRTLMTVAEYSELLRPGAITLGSGIRSFSLPAARRLLARIPEITSQQNKKRFRTYTPKGFELEDFLDVFFIKNRKELNSTLFLQASAFRQNLKRRTQQMDERVAHVQSKRFKKLAKKTRARQGFRV